MAPILSKSRELFERLRKQYSGEPGTSCLDWTLEELVPNAPNATQLPRSATWTAVRPWRAALFFVPLGVR